MRSHLLRWPPGPQLFRRGSARTRAEFHHMQDLEGSHSPLEMLGYYQARDSRVHGGPRAQRAVRVQQAGINTDHWAPRHTWTPEHARTHVWVSQADSAGSIPVTRSTREKRCNTSRSGAFSYTETAPVGVLNRLPCHHPTLSSAPAPASSPSSGLVFVDPAGLAFALVAASTISLMAAAMARSASALACW